MPPGDPTVFTVVRDASTAVTPRHAATRWTVVTVTLFTGRTASTKAALYRAVLEILADHHVPTDDVLIVLEEVAVANWGIQGGQAADTVDVGFTIEI